MDTNELFEQFDYDLAELVTEYLEKGLPSDEIIAGMDMRMSLVKIEETQINP